jgi:anti-sigma factor RsiW
VTCDKIRNELDAFAGRELSEKRKAVVEEHLRSCEECRRELAKLERLAAILHADSIPEVPANLAARIAAHGKSQLAQSKRAHLPRIYWWDAMPALTRAAAVLVMLVGLGAGAWLGLKVAANSHAQIAVVASEEADIAASTHADYLSDSPSGSTANVYMALANSTGGGR